MAAAVPSHSGPEPPAAENPAKVAGINRMELAKIGGITPATFSFNGRCELSPPNIWLPIWRFGYWIKMRRCERSTKTMKPMTMTDMTSRKTIKIADKAPVRPSSRVPAKADGKFATIPAKMISEIPLPTPRAVICSPSHIRKIVPPTSVITAVMRKNMPGSITGEPWEVEKFSKPTAIP